MGYSNLSLEEYAHLSMEGYSQLPLEGGTGGGSGGESGGESGGGSCAWTSATITSLQQTLESINSRLSALETAVSSLPTSTLTVAQVREAVWKATLSSYTTTGTTGKKLNDIVKDVWGATLSNYITNGTAGKRLKDIISDVWGANISNCNTTGTAGKKLKDIVSDVWGVDISNYNTTGTAGKKLKDIVSDVWNEDLSNYIADRTPGRALRDPVDLSGIPYTLSALNTTVNSLPNLSALAVWNYGTVNDRTVKATDVQLSGNAQVDYSAIANSVWDLCPTSLPNIGYEMAELTAAVNCIPSSVWNYYTVGDRAVSANVTIDNEAIADAVWAQSSRTLTDLPSALKDRLPASGTLATQSDVQVTVTPTTQMVNALTTAQLTTLTNNIRNGLAKSSELPTIPTDYAKEATLTAVQNAVSAIPTQTYDLSGLSTFDPTIDKVTVNATQAVAFSNLPDLTDINANLATLKGYTDTLESSAATIIDYVDDLEGMVSNLPTASAIQNGLATSAEVTALSGKIDNINISTIPTDYAKEATLNTVKSVVEAIPATTYTIPTVEEIQDGLAKSADIPTTSAISSAVWNYGESENNRTVKASAIELDSNTLDVSVDTDAIADAVWEHESATALSSSIANIPTVDSVQGVQDALNLISGQLGNWEVSDNQMIVYGSDNQEIARFDLTKDECGIITKIEKAEEP